MAYLGDFRLGDTVTFKFATTAASTGAPTTLSGSPVVSAYPGSSTTQLTAGITLTVDFDSVTGLNHVTVVASSGNGYATATNYDLVITTGTVGGTSAVGYVIGSFSIENRSAVMPTTAGRTLDIAATGEAGIDLDNVLLTNGSPKTGIKASGTLSGTHSTTTADLGTNAPSDDIGGCVLVIPTRGVYNAIDSYNTGTGVVTFSPALASDTLTNGDQWYIFFGARASTGAPPGVNMLMISGDTTAADNLEAALDGTGGVNLSLAAVNITAGMSITQSTANADALVVTGNGTGNGASFKSGTGATGQGINITSQATNGSALVCTAAGTGTGFSASGGTSGKGALFAAGATGTAGLAVTGGGTSGAGITVTTTSGDAIQAIATAGHGMSLTANGTNKHGLVATGGTAGTSDGIKGVAGSGGIDIRGDITANAMVESYPADGAAPTIAQALMLTMQSVGEVSVSGTTLTVKKLDGSTTAATYTLDSSSAPTSRTRAS